MGCGCRGDSAKARIALSQSGALHWRSRFRKRENLRSLCLVPGSTYIPRNFFLLEYGSVSGAPHAGALPHGAGKNRMGAYLERFWSVGRTLAALLENAQNADGAVTIPAALRPYLGGLEQLEPSA